MTELADNAAALLDLHTAPEILVLANVWDVVSAQVVAVTDGVRALATASHSIASTFGYEDGENIPLDLHLDMVGRIVRRGRPAGDDGLRGRLRRRRRDRPPRDRDRRRRRQPRGPDEAARRGGRRGRGGRSRAGRDAGIDFVLNARTDAFVRATRDADREQPRRARRSAAAGPTSRPARPSSSCPASSPARRSTRWSTAWARSRLSVISVPGVSLPGPRAAGARRRPRLDRALHPAGRADRAAGRRRPSSWPAASLPEGTRALN